METKRIYEKPLLQKVRLEAKTSVLAACNTTTNAVPQNVPVNGAGCYINACYGAPAPTPIPAPGFNSSR